MLDLFFYDNEKTVTLTGDNSSLDTAIKAVRNSVAGEFVSWLIESINKLVEGPQKEVEFRFLRNVVRGNAVSAIASEVIRVTYDDSEETFSIANIATGILGSTAVALGLFKILGGGTILGSTALFAVGTSLLWSAIQEIGEEIYDLIEGAVVPKTDIQLLDRNGNIKGGALSKQGLLSKAQEFEAVRALLNRTGRTNFPDAVVEEDQIQVVDRNDVVSFVTNTYNIFDGTIVNAVAAELGIPANTLLSLGQENSPNTNAQIIEFSDSRLPSFVFASLDNRFFVPLPDSTGAIKDVGILPSHIVLGSRNDETLDVFTKVISAYSAFLEKDEVINFDDIVKEDVLVLGLDRDDTIEGYVTDDFILGGSGNDVIDGSGGKDTVLFSDDFANYEYSLLDDGRSIFSHVRGTRTDYVDVLTNVEFASFRDQTVSLPLSQNPSGPKEETNSLVTYQFSSNLDLLLPTTSTNTTEVGLSPQVNVTLTIDPSEDMSSLSREGLYSIINATLKINNELVSINTPLIGSVGDIRVIDSSPDDRFNYDRFLIRVNRFKEPVFLFGQEVIELYFDVIDPNKTTFINDSLPTDFNFSNLSLISYFRIQTGDRGGSRSDLLRILQTTLPRFSTTVIPVDPEEAALPEFADAVPRTPFLLTSIPTPSEPDANSIPVAVDDFADTEVNNPISISIEDVLLNDRDTNGSGLSLERIGNVVHGTALLSGKNIIFTPDLGFLGFASFDYVVSDNNGGSDTATVTIQVEPNKAPVAVNDIIFTEFDEIISTIANSILLKNDIDDDGDTLTLQDVSNPLNGTVKLVNDGVIFTPDIGFVGRGGFSYTITDGRGAFDTADVAVQVGNQFPTARDDNFTLPSNVSELRFTIRTLLANDSDPDFDLLNFVGISVINPPQDGRIIVEGEQVIFHPGPAYLDEFRFNYTIDDGRGGFADAIVTITVNQINNVPTIKNMSFIGQENTTIKFSSSRFIDAFADNDSDFLTQIQITSLPSNGNLNFNSEPVLTNQEISISDLDQLTFTPDDNFNGKTSFSWKGFDGTAYSSGNAIAFIKVFNIQNGGVNSEILEGKYVNDLLRGRQGKDTLIGNAGNDILLGGIGDDTVYGGAGNDFIRGDAGADNLDGGDGIDVVDYRISSTSVTVNLETGLTSGGDAEGDSLTNFEKVYGSNHDDELTGDEANNTLIGRAGDDTINGGAGNDFIRGDAGADSLDGGDGIDVVDYRISSTSVTVNLETGLTSGGDAEGDSLTNFEKVYGSNHDDELTGDEANNTLIGRAGDDTINGGTGNDFIRGDAGADSLDGGDGIDVVDYRISSTSVTVNLETGLTSGGDAEGDSLTNFERIYGSNHGDELTGDATNNLILGRAGDDTINGGAGNDIIRGEAGADSLDGGTGLDTVDYRTSKTSVFVNLESGSAAGGDAEGDSLTNFERIYGSNHDDELTGDATNNLILGRAGDDTINGGSGNDVIRGESGADRLTGGDGRNTFHYVSLTDSQLANLDHITDLKIGIDRINASVAGSIFHLSEQVLSFDEIGIQTVLGDVTAANSSFSTNGAAVTFRNNEGQTFLAINDNIAGFQSANDSIIEISGFSGLLSNLQII